MNLDDWRLTGQEKYMMKIHLNTLNPHEYASQLSEPKLWHDHCEFCMDKIDMNSTRACYCTDDKYRFVCEECFNDFKEYFDWKID